MGLTIEGSGLVVDLESDAFRHLDDGAGWGMPQVALQWFDGAGDGSTLRGGRVLRRSLRTPVLVRASSAQEVDDRLNRLARILSFRNPARFRRTDPSGQTWTLTVVRESGGDWAWGQDTDGRSWAATTLGLVAGQPYWEREEVAQVPVVPAGASEGLLDPYSLAETHLAASQALGTVTLDNPGSAPSPVTIQVNGPATHLEVTGPNGEHLEWDGALAAGEWLQIVRGRATDDTGANRYTELAAAPAFWDVQPGVSSATVNLTGAGATTAVILSWQPRKWVQFA